MKVSDQWAEIVERARPLTLDKPHEPAVPDATDVPVGAPQGSVSLPDRPWGDPGPRRNGWAAATIAIVVVAVVLWQVAGADPALVLVGSVVLLMPIVRRLVTAQLELQLSESAPAREEGRVDRAGDAPSDDAPAEPAV
jgi:hypothetical protein